MRGNEIQIVPVANGFVVYLPETRNELKQMGAMILGLGKTMKQNELMGDLNTNPEDEEQEQDDAPKKFNRDKSCYIFATFSEVIAFLKVTFD